MCVLGSGFKDSSADENLGFEASGCKVSWGFGQCGEVCSSFWVSVYVCSKKLQDMHMTHTSNLYIYSISYTTVIYENECTLSTVKLGCLDIIKWTQILYWTSVSQHCTKIVSWSKQTKVNTTTVWTSVSCTMVKYVTLEHKSVISSTGIFVAIANNILFRSKLWIFLSCPKSLGY